VFIPDIYLVERDECLRSISTVDLQPTRQPENLLSYKLNSASEGFIVIGVVVDVDDTLVSTDRSMPGCLASGSWV